MSQTLFSSLDRNMPILVVDDYPSMRRIVRNCLKQLGFENITEAEDANSALEKLQSGEFQFVISDWSLPEMTGEALLHEMCSNDRFKTLPMLVVAAEREREKVTPIQEKRAASAVIVKPFTTSILQKKMEEAWEKEEGDQAAR